MYFTNFIAHRGNFLAGCYLFTVLNAGLLHCHDTIRYIYVCSKADEMASLV